MNLIIITIVEGTEYNIYEEEVVESGQFHCYIGLNLINFHTDTKLQIKKLAIVYNG